VWADIQPLSGREAVFANRISAQLTHQFTVRYQAGSVMVRSSSAEGVKRVSAVPSTPSAFAPATSYPVPAAPGNEEPMSCERVAEDAAQITLMVIGLQRWYDRQIQSAQ
jgi:hypothetical protein